MVLVIFAVLGPKGSSWTSILHEHSGRYWRSECLLFLGLFMVEV